MAAVRWAEATWSGDLTSGSGTIDYVSSGVFSRLPVAWESRTEEHGGRTSPEELLAMAHASCFSMALSGALGRAGTPPERLDVKATVTFAKAEAGWKVASSAIEVNGRVPGASADDFQAAAEKARDGCPISVALKGNVELSVTARLGETAEAR